MTIQPARHECHACCPIQAEKPGILPVVGNTRGTRGGIAGCGTFLVTGYRNRPVQIFE